MKGKKVSTKFEREKDLFWTIIIITITIMIMLNLFTLVINSEFNFDRYKGDNIFQKISYYNLDNIGETSYLTTTAIILNLTGYHFELIAKGLFIYAIIRASIVLDFKWWLTAIYCLLSLSFSIIPIIGMYIAFKKGKTSLLERYNYMGGRLVDEI